MLRQSGSLGESTLANGRPILEIPRGQEMNGSGSRKSGFSLLSKYSGLGGLYSSACDSFYKLISQGLLSNHIHTSYIQVNCTSSNSVHQLSSYD